MSWFWVGAKNSKCDLLNVCNWFHILLTRAGAAGSCPHMNMSAEYNDFILSTGMYLL